MSAGMSLVCVSVSVCLREVLGVCENVLGFWHRNTTDLPQGTLATRKPFLLSVSASLAKVCALVRW